MWLASVVMASLIAVLLLEFSLPYWRPAAPPIYQSDPLLGWRLRPDLDRLIEQTSLEGTTYDVAFATDANGLRTVGTNARAPIRVLVLGDSYTADPFASNDRMWYAKMVEQLAVLTQRPLDDYHVSAGGGGGYGTYQAALLAEQLGRTVNPTLFIHQFCGNDFTNNHYGWEAESIVWNQYLLRPYATLGAEEPYYHTGFSAFVYRSLYGRSRLFTRVAQAVQAWRFNWYGAYFPSPPRNLATYEAESVALTRSLLTELRTQFARTPAVMVNCEEGVSGPERLWTALAQDAGFVPITSPSEAVLEAQAGGAREIFHADGGHLSDAGNQLYGSVLADTLVSLRLAD